MLKRLITRLLSPFRKDRTPSGFNGMTCEELAELYKSRGWPPPGKGRKITFV